MVSCVGYLLTPWHSCWLRKKQQQFESYLQRENNSSELFLVLKVYTKFIQFEKRSMESEYKWNLAVQNTQFWLFWRWAVSNSGGSIFLFSSFKAEMFTLPEFILYFKVCIIEGFLLQAVTIVVFVFQFVLVLPEIVIIVLHPYSTTLQPSAFFRTWTANITS